MDIKEKRKQYYLNNKEKKNEQTQNSIIMRIDLQDFNIIMI